MEIEIRPYNISDKDACMDAFVSNVPEYFATHEVKLFEDWLNGPVSGADNYFYVLLIDHDIVGCGGFGYEKNNNDVRFIWGLVHRKYHKKGLGKKLFEFRMEEIKRLYPDVPIRLDTTQHSYGFFQKYGFKVDKITENFYAPGFDRYDMTYTE